MLILKQPIVHSPDNIECGYGITTDEMNIILYKLSIVQTGKKAGEVSKTALGYFSTIKDVLERVKMYEVVSQGVEDLEALERRVSSTIDACVAHLDKLNYKKDLNYLFVKELVIK